MRANLPTQGQAEPMEFGPDRSNPAEIKNRIKIIPFGSAIEQPDAFLKPKSRGANRASDIVPETYVSPYQLKFEDGAGIPKPVPKYSFSENRP